jgi:hypothetical protein
MNAEDIRRQRDQALACMILALCIAAAAFLSVFGDTDSLAIEQARRTAEVHEGLLRGTKEALRQNVLARDAARSALEAIQKSRRP